MPELLIAAGLLLACILAAWLMTDEDEGDHNQWLPLHPDDSPVEEDDDE